ncbi:hypothetical protein PybrP1_003360 [[Pythium] brassicae (nom. inval.)]|nr:hypothetical protein PybrP1_003360 [[Pythium] brassicae (nom. inval.)]
MNTSEPLVLGTRCELLSASAPSSTVVAAAASGLRARLRRFGHVAFVGPVPSLPAGEWVGVRLEQPLGRGDGTLAGVRYFDAPPLHAAFVRRERLRISPEGSDASDTSTGPAHGRKSDTERELRTDELALRFWRRFAEEEADVRAQLAAFVEQRQEPTGAVAPTSGTLSADALLDALVLRVSAMREEAAAAAGAFLSPYDVRQTQNIVAKLLELVEATRSTFAPRKKFMFRARAKKSAAATGTGTGTQSTDENKDATNRKDDSPEQDASTTPNQPPQATQQPPADLDELVHANLRDQVIIVDQQNFASNPSQRRDLSFSQLTNCVVFVGVDTSAIRCDALTNCVVLTGPVWGSVWLENCHACEFVVASRQLRVHQSSTTSFHLRIGSHPIIEDCRGLAFGPYRLQYTGLDEQLAKIGLLADTGLWSRVLDFKWHRAQQSPNWSVRDPKMPLPPVPAQLEGLLTLT